MKKSVLALLLAVSAPAFAFQSTGASLDLTVFGPSASTSAISQNKEVIVAAEEDAADYLIGRGKSINLRAALVVLREAGVEGSEAELAALILQAVQE